MVLAETRAARATSWRVFHGGANGTDWSASVCRSSSVFWTTRAARISFLRRAIRPRWKSVTLRRASWLSIIHSLTSSIDSKLSFWTVRKGMPCWLQMA
jgi:hypothetical protein